MHRYRRLFANTRSSWARVCVWLLIGVWLSLSGPGVAASVAVVPLSCEAHAMPHIAQADGHSTHERVACGDDHCVASTCCPHGVLPLAVPLVARADAALERPHPIAATPSGVYVPDLPPPRV